MTQSTHPTPARQRQDGRRLWSIEEDALVCTLPPGEVARRTGRTLSGIYGRRSCLRRRGVHVRAFPYAPQRFGVDVV